MIKKIAIFVVIIVLVVIIMNMPEKEEESFKGFNIRNVDYSSKGNDVGSFHTENYEVDLSYIKNALRSSDLFEVMPKDAIIAMQFFDGNGFMTSNGLTIYSSGEIKESIDKNYDFKIITGDYYIQHLNYNGICEVYKTIKENKDYDVELQKSRISLSWKYRDLMSYCLL